MLEQLEQQRSLTTNQRKTCAAATIGDMLDFFDFYLIGFSLAFVVKGWSLTYGQSGAILLFLGNRSTARLAFLGLDGRQDEWGCTYAAAGMLRFDWPRNHSDAAPQRRDHLALPRGMSF